MKNTIELNSQEIRNGVKAIFRQDEINAGMRFATHRVHKNKKAYSRKPKHKLDY